MTKQRPTPRGAPASKAPMPQPPPLPPPLPDPGELERLAAAAEPSPQGAWWITLQAVEHLLSSVARTDPRTGDALPQSLQELLAAMNMATARGRRPFPRDLLFFAAEFAAEPLAELLERHRTRIVRTYEQLPFHSLREVDSRSLAWLARRPGRNVREKLAGRTHVLGVKRELTADTAENRLIRSFANIIARRGAERLEHMKAYDQAEVDRKLSEQLAGIVQLCDERMRRSELAEVPAITRIRPNNVLLSDPLYSRVFRAWRWMRDAEDRLRLAWAAVPDRIRVTLFWLAAALLASNRRALLGDTLSRVSAGREDDSFGVEVLGQEQGATAWLARPELELLLTPASSKERPFLIRLSLQGELLLARIARLEGQGLLRRETDLVPLRFHVKLTAESLAQGRGIPAVVDGIEPAVRGGARGNADVEGLRSLAERISQSILARCGAQASSARPSPPGRSRLAEAEDARVGVELSSTMLLVSDGKPGLLATKSWTAAHPLPGDSGRAEWLDGRFDRVLTSGLPGRQLWSLGDVLDPETEDDPGELAIAMRRMVDALAHELDLAASARVAYAVPDSVDEFSQRTIRVALSSAFRKAIPVWRSVAAAIAWQLTPSFQKRVKPGDHAVVIDAEFLRPVITLLVARHDGKLEQQHPASSGIYWERKPPLPPDEELELLSWQQLLRDYATGLVTKAVGNTKGVLGPEEQQRIVDDLMRTGRLSELVEGRASQLVRFRAAGGENALTVELSHDDKDFRARVDRWLQRVLEAVGTALTMLSVPRSSRTHLVFAGGPCVLPWFPEALTRKPRLKQPGGGELSAISISSPGIAAGARDCLLRMDAGVPAWKEWLPDLSLEVVTDGHYGELPLIDRATSVDPFLGQAMILEVPQWLMLERGKPWYSFPLIVGRQTRRPFSWEARLESPAFPLDRDTRAILRLSYTYGLETSYQLTVEPESTTEASFTRVEARWIRAGETSAAPVPQEASPVSIKEWKQTEADKFVKAAQLVSKSIESEVPGYILPLTKACWSQGRSLATAPQSVVAVFGPFRDKLLRGLPSGELNPQEVPRALEILAALHEDAPAEVGKRVLELDEAAGDHPQEYWKTSSMLSTLVGDATGSRRVYLDRLLYRLRLHTAPETFNLSLANTMIGAFRDAAWRHPGFVTELGHSGDAVQRLIAQCTRSLQSLRARVPLELDSDVERERLKKLGRQFRVACELLLALSRLSGTEAGAALRCGTPSADGLAKAVRQLDARLAHCGIKPDWSVRIEAQVPKSLRRMSDVAFALNEYLSGGGTNLVHVIGDEPA